MAAAHKCREQGGAEVVHYEEVRHVADEQNIMVLHKARRSIQDSVVLEEVRNSISVVCMVPCVASALRLPNSSLCMAGDAPRSNSPVKVAFVGQSGCLDMAPNLHVDCQSFRVPLMLAGHPHALLNILSAKVRGDPVFGIEIGEDFPCDDGLFDAPSRKLPDGPISGSYCY